MYKYLISILLVLNSYILAKYEDSSPSKTTLDDLKILNNFENLLYSKTYISLNECKQNEIINLIYQNKEEEFDYNRLVVKLNGQINNEERFANEDGTIQDRDKASIQLKATYPIFDKRTDIEIKKKKIEFKNKLITDVSKYCTLKNELHIIEDEVELLNLKQLRAKAREDAGQIYLDDRITLIEEIIKKKNEFSKASIELNTIKLQLINKIKISQENRLKGLL